MAAVAGCLLSSCGAQDAPADDPEPAEAGAAAVWRVAGQVDDTATSFEASVSRLGCNSGVTGEVLAPEITYADDVVVTFEVLPKEVGDANCQGNEWVDHTVELDEPLAGRSLVDGACAAGEEAATTSFCQNPIRWDSKTG